MSVRAYHEKVRNQRSVAHGSTAASRTFLATQVALPLERPGCGGYCCCHWLGLKLGLGFCFPRRHYQRSVASQWGHTFNRHALRLGMPYSLGVYHLARLALQDSARSMSPTPGANAGGPRQLPIRTRRLARIAQLRSATERSRPYEDLQE